MNIAVLGAGGTIAPALVRDLAASEEVTSLMLFDRDGPRVRAVARVHGAGRTDAYALDATRDVLIAVLEDFDVLVNAASYSTNLAAMDACLATETSYIDLGGLYKVTAQQLTYSAEFEKHGLLALLGAGAGPGKTNVMALRGARELDEVRSVRCASAGVDLDPPEGFSTPYSIETLFDEMTMAPVALRDGEPVELEPLAEGGTIVFPEPIGERTSLFTLHSEVLTLGDSLGAPNVDFRLSLSPTVELALRDIAAGGSLPRQRPAPPSAQTYSAQLVELTGMRGATPTRVVVTALTVPHEEWGLGGGIVSTGAVAAAAVRLMARGEVTAKGAHPPERVLDPEQLFAELEARGCSFEITTSEVSEVP